MVLIHQLPKSCRYVWMMCEISKNMEWYKFARIDLSVPTRVGEARLEDFQASTRGGVTIGHLVELPIFLHL